MTIFIVRNFRNPRWETADVVGLIATLVYFGGGHSDNVWQPRQIGLTSKCLLLFSRLGAIFFDFECIWVAKSDFKQFGGNISPLSFFVCYLRNFLYKAPWGIH